MSHLPEIEAFVTVVREGSFSAAGSRLGLSSSYVSKLVTRLEERLGTRMLHRTTRRLALTEAGERLYEPCAGALETLGQAQDQVSALQATLRGRLRVTLPTGLKLSRAVSEFAAANPGLTIDALYLDRQVDLVAEGLDVGIRVGPLPDSSLIARRLATAVKGLFASPAYLARRDGPTQVEDLREHDCLVYSYTRAPTSWTLSDEDGSSRSVAVSGPLVTNTGAALCDAACCGLGIVFVPEFHTAAAVEAGQLVRVLPKWGVQMPISAVYPSTQHLPLKVRSFVEHLEQALKEAPWRRDREPEGGRG